MIEKNQNMHQKSRIEQGLERDLEGCTAKMTWVKPELISISTKGTESGGIPNFSENASTFTFFSAS